MARREKRQRRGPFRVNPRTGALEITIVLTLYDDPLRDGAIVAYIERALTQGVKVATSVRALLRQGGVVSTPTGAPGEAAPEVCEMDLSAIGDEM